MTTSHPAVSTESSASVRVHRIEIRPAPGRADPRGDAVARAARSAGFMVDEVRSCRVYLIEGALSDAEVAVARDRLLRDAVLESASSGASAVGGGPGDGGGGIGWSVVEVHPLPGVMDPAAQSVRAALAELLGRGAADAGLEALHVSTGWRYDVRGSGGAALDESMLKRMAEATVANRVVQGIHSRPWMPTSLPRGQESEFRLRTAAIRGKSDEELIAFSREAHLFMSLDELRAVRAEYDRLGRDPTDIELETIAQTWSEHCVHKTLKSRVRYRRAETDRSGRVGSAKTGGDSAGSAASGAKASPGGSGQRFGLEFSFGPAGKAATPRRIDHHDDVDGDDDSDSNSVGGAGAGDPIAWEGRPGHEVMPDGTIVIDNLLKSTVAAATHELIADGVDWTLSVFKDNSGVIEFDDEFGVCVKVETHNRPSALEPYGGAATGAGGCIRDVIGTGLGAKPIASTDVFCVAHPTDTDSSRGGRARVRPPGTLHPKRILTEVVAGVRDYGNRMGIPTISGAVHFDDRFVGNPLVFCGCIGLIPRGLVHGQAGAGDRIIAIGGRTGRDGIHGATFSSAELEQNHADEFAHAVQIGNAIEEKRVLDAILRAREEGADVKSVGKRPLFTAMTDCGAGGFSSAVGEMGKDLGAEVHLERAPLKYAGLSYTEIWISEAQERMVLAVPAENVPALRRICDEEGVELADLGVFGTTDRTLRLSYKGHRVGELSMEFLHDGLPQVTREAVWPGAVSSSADWSVSGGGGPGRVSGTMTSSLLSLLSHPTIASKHWIIRQYDHEVQGNVVVKPLVGPSGRGPGDASMLEPVPGTGRGLAVSCGLQIGMGDPSIGGDPYWMALGGIDECVRNLVCVGVDPSRIAILDNFCWPSCEKPENLGGLVRAAEGCYDGAKAYRTPFVSGKDSLNNQLRYEDPTTGEKRVIEIPPTLLITGIGIVPKIARAVTMDAKKAGNLLVLLGRTSAAMGGSVYSQVASIAAMGEDATATPTVDLTLGPATARAVAQLIRDGVVVSAHDCSDGGLLVAVAEMLIATVRGDVPEEPVRASEKPATIDAAAVIRSILMPGGASADPDGAGGVGGGAVLSALLAGGAKAGAGTSPNSATGATSAVPGAMGAELTIWDDMLEAEQTAFAETPSRYVLEIKPEELTRVRTVLRDYGGISATPIGTLNASGRLVWRKGDVDAAVTDLASAWLSPLDW